MGLFASANIIVRDSDVEESPKIGMPVRWVEGFSYRPEACNGGGVYDSTTDGALPAADSLASQIDVAAFEVVGSDTSSTFGATGTPELWQERIDIARRDLLATEQKQVEKELFSGALTTAAATGNNFLRKTPTLIEGDRLVGYVSSLAALEQAIADNLGNGIGTIHCTRKTAIVWDQNGLLRRVGNQILTLNDTIVIAGAGYDGKAPTAGTTGLDPSHAGALFSTDSAWAYATGIVDLRLGAVREPTSETEQLNVSTNKNTRALYVRRSVAVTFSCLQVGVHVDHLNAISTTGS